MSSLVECPICSKMISKHKINLHIDLECRGSSNTESSNTQSSNQSKVQLQIQLLENPSSSTKAQSAPVKPNPPLSIISEQSRLQPPISMVNQSKKRKRKNDTIPLAERSRPTSFEDLIGQECMNQESDLQVLLHSKSSNNLPSMIFFGPPGCGKTSTARMIGKRASIYFEYSATVNNIADIRVGAETALKHLQETGQKGVIFIDEIHRFTKAQQDVFLGSVERGDYVLLGATTENPSFRVNNALLSRCRVFTFQKLEVVDLLAILDRAVSFLLIPDDSPKEVSVDVITPEIKRYLAEYSDGDARAALNALEQIWQAYLTNSKPPSLESVQKAFMRSGVLYDRDGEEHYNIISALHKSMRGSDENASLYWLGRMIYAGEDPLYVARRLVRFASEDIGLANNEALPLALAAYHSCQVIGMPECDVILAHCVAFLTRSPKSVEVYKAIKKVKSVIGQEANYPVPLHLRNAPTPLMKELEYGKGYIYNPDHKGPVTQTYLPPQLQTKNFFPN